MSTLSEPPLLPAAPSQQRWFTLRWWLTRSFWTLTCLCVAFALWALWYVNNRGFTKKWRGMLSRELVKRGVYAEIGRLNLNPLKGLIARNVRIFHDDEREQVFAYIDEIVLDINYSHLVFGQPFINAMDLRQASVSIPTDPNDRKSQRLEIEQINARVLLPPGQVSIPLAEAKIHGLQVTATDCLLFNPGTVGPLSRESAREREHFLLTFRDTVRRLAAMEMRGGKPVLSLQFQGDFSDPSKLTATATLRSEPFVIRGEHPVRGLNVKLHYSGGTLRLDECVLADAHGDLDLSGSFHPAQRRAAFALRSNLDLPGLWRALRLPGKLEKFRLRDPAHLEFQGELVLPSPEETTPAPNAPAFVSFAREIQLLGRIELGRFEYAGAPFHGAAADFSWDGRRWFLRDARLDHAEGSLHFSALQEGDAFRFSIDSRISPAVFRPLLPPKGQALLDEWNFENVPLFRLEGKSSPSFSWKTLEATGYIALGRTSHRDVALQSLTSDLLIDHEVVRFPAFRLERREGIATGAFVLDLPGHVARLEGVKTRVTPAEVAVWVDREGHLPHALAPYRFKAAPPRLEIDGTVGLFHERHRTNLKIEADAEAMEYTFVGRDLLFPKLAATLRIVGERLRIESLRATLFGGTVAGEADISIRRGEEDYTAKATVSEVDFPTLTGLYFRYDTAKGKLSGHAAFSGLGNVARNIKGEGFLKVADGNVFAIPVFGPFSSILEQILPGAGYDKAQQASAHFTMDSGVIETDDFEVRGSGFSMYGGGKLFFLDDKIDFSIRINAQGAAGVVLSPVSHLFEYVSDETLSKPVWRPKRLPKALFSQ
ncbi:MAG TPA: AsmA-like C-terminal region-containing protein [Chthoniobacteraceae bacterium]|nr:AsmA-like C-terminal region-containing protein [Chthoniobacteraceae bacterium]